MTARALDIDIVKGLIVLLVCGLVVPCVIGRADSLETLRVLRGRLTPKTPLQPHTHACCKYGIN